MMMAGPISAALWAVSGRAFRRWFVRLGGIGLIPLGLLDSSIIPIPGSMDLLTIVLSARQQELWFYYALMATAGSVFGAFLTYRLAQKGGQKTLQRKLRRWQMDKIKSVFERWGFSAIAVPALMPPPVPMVPFVLAAGATQYPLRKFLAAIIVGRVVRYSILAFLAATYGRKIIGLIAAGSHAALWAVAGFLIATALVAFFFWRAIRRQERVAN